MALGFLRLKPAPANLSDAAAAARHFEAVRSLFGAWSGLLADEPSASLSLELAANAGSIAYIVGVPADWQTEIVHHLYAAFPQAEISQLEEWSLFDTGGELAAATLRFSPSEAKIRSESFTGLDPLAPILEVLGATQTGERLCLQLLLRSAASPTPASRLVAGLHDGLTGSLRQLLSGPSRSTESVAATEDTKSAPLQANLRVMALAATQVEAANLVRRAATAYHHFVIPGSSSLRYQTPRRLDPWLKTALLRQTQSRASFRLTPAEAANLYHPPLQPRAHPQLDALASTRLPLPTALADTGITIGYGAFRDRQQPIRLHPADRLRHTYLIGQTGTGKSTLFQSAILQDMAAGDGCCFIDPHGEVIDWLLPRIPKHRAADVVLFDPSDPQALLGLNLLEWRTPHERDLLIQELILLFYKLFDPGHTGVIGPQFEHWLRNAALTITEPAIRGTLVDIPRLFTDKSFSQAIVARAHHPAVKDFWHNQMAQTADFHKSEMLNYFTSKFGGFLGNAVMHQILSQRTSAFDLRTLMDRRKILLVNLSKGKLGSLNAQLLGTLMVAKLQLAALSRADVAPEHRPPFYVYIDEFQNIVTDSFAHMLSEIRKYGVGLHLAHQYSDQLPDSIKQAVIGNVGTLMAFRLGHTDAGWLAPHFAPLTTEDLTNIPPYHYHLRTLVQGQLTTPFTVAAPLLETTPQPALEQALRTRIRQYVAATRGARA